MSSKRKRRLIKILDKITGIEELHDISGAAEQEDEAALCNLGICYLNGDAVPEDPSKARELFLKSYKSGNGQATRILGIIYRDGQGVPPNAAQAMRWFQRSAEMGCTEGQRCLGDCYYVGEGVG